MSSVHRNSVLSAFGALALVACAAWAAEPEWPGFRGPDANPTAAKGRLPEKWSKTENVEWSTTIPGRGWSSPVVNGRNVFLTTVVTDGKSKQPQIGTEYSNEYVAELMKQGLGEKDVLDRVTARDIELAILPMPDWRGRWLKARLRPMAVSIVLSTTLASLHGRSKRVG